MAREVLDSVFNGDDRHEEASVPDGSGASDLQRRRLRVLRDRKRRIVAAVRPQVGMRLQPVQYVRTVQHVQPGRILFADDRPERMRVRLRRGWRDRRRDDAAGADDFPCRRGNYRLASIG